MPESLASAVGGSEKKFLVDKEDLYTAEVMSTEVFSIRIRKDLKRQAEELNIDVKAIVEWALAEAIERAKMERLRESIKTISHQMKEISEDH